MTANQLGSIRVIESAHARERIQWRFPRSKKRRIRAKWENREENWRYEPRAFRHGENTIICHPSIAARLRASLQQLKMINTKTK
jgi:hypothetical protein